MWYPMLAGFAFASAAAVVSENTVVTALLALAGIVFSLLTHETRQGGTVTPVPALCWAAFVYGGTIPAILTVCGAILAGLMFHWRTVSLRNLFLSYIPPTAMIITVGALLSPASVYAVLLIPGGIILQSVSRGMLEGWNLNTLSVTSMNWIINAVTACAVIFFIAEDGYAGGLMVISVMAIFMSHTARTGNRLLFSSGRIGILSLQNRIISFLYREDNPYPLYFYDGRTVWTMQGKPFSGIKMPPAEKIIKGNAEGWSAFPVGTSALIAADSAAEEIRALPAKQLRETLLLVESIWRASFSKRRLENAFLGAAGILVRIADRKDSDTHRHSIRVSQTAVRLGKIMGLQEDELFQLKIGAMLHDIGKLTVPGSLIMKKGLLTEEERLVIESHPRTGAKLLEPMERYGGASLIVQQHHERIDGTGYPDGLRGREISLHARIVAVADTFDAIISPRAYHLGKPAHIALREIMRFRGTCFDAAVVDALKVMLK